MITLPLKAYLPRKVVSQALGGRRALERIERGGQLTRHYPAGLRHARYKYADVKRVLDDLMGGNC